MIINEKALLRAMKEAYKGSGYHVAAFDGGGCEKVLIYAESWMVTVERKNAPSKIRGFVAETAGDWPEVNEAYRVRKDMTESEQIEMTLNNLYDVWLNFDDKDSTEQVKPTELLLGLSELWQCCRSLHMLLLDPAFTDIIGNSRLPVIRSGNILRVQGEISTIYLYQEKPAESIEDRIKHLEKVRWVAER